MRYPLLGVTTTRVPVPFGVWASPFFFHGHSLSKSDSEGPHLCLGMIPFPAGVQLCQGGITRNPKREAVQGSGLVSLKPVA